MWNKYIGKAAIIGLAALVIMVLMLLMVSGSAAQNHVSFVGIENPTDSCILLDGNQQPLYLTDEDDEGKINIVGDGLGTPGTQLLTCDYIGAPAEQGAEEWNYVNTSIPCLVNGLDVEGNSTDDWKITVSAHGNVKLTCHFGDQFD